MGKFIYPDENEFIELDIHLMSNNYLYSYTTRGICKSRQYVEWIAKFNELDIPNREHWVDVDWNEPLEVFLHYVAMPNRDTHNGDKSAIDGIIGRHYHYDDKNVRAVHNRRVGMCSSYKTGKIRFYIRNIDNN